ncbi:sporozoite developmental protein [Cystoisospora suis]|uniref:Sporozoite developmental protein n=1 Tax=Cystoisospora suis TaxID=483139 RepID=A0A2C6KYB5_9APIC|nr:sporozoite developmental protein [Cystoisospora suis]
MLFLGTKKHPEPDSYDSFITEHGGQNNAYTDEEKTVFFNQVADNSLEEALDRFSEFFKAPLFNPDYEEREAHAVNSEHEKNIPNDEERTWFTIRSLAKGPLSSFATGNLQTLSVLPKQQGIDVVAKLKDFHKKYYCASNMVDKTHDHKSSSYHRRPTRQLSLCRQGRFPSKKLFYGRNSRKKQPISMLTYLFEYPGNGSLAKRLRQMGSGDKVSVVADRTSVNTLFAVKVELTKKGAEQRGVVLQEVFKYINLLKSQGVNSRVISSIAEQSRVDFHTSQPSGSLMNEVARLAHNLLTYEPYHVIAGDAVVLDPDSRYVNHLLTLMTPERAIVAFSDPDFRQTAKSPKIEPFYGVEHTVADLPEQQMTELTNIVADNGIYRVPPAFSHVPKADDLKLKPGISGMSVPELLGEQDPTFGHSIWWQGQGTLPVPRVNINMKARTPSKHTNITSQTTTAVLIAAIAEQLEEETVDLENCGISQRLGVAGDGLHIAFAAHTPQQLQHIMEIVAKKFRDPVVEEERFERIKQRIIDELEDPASMMAYEHALETAAVLLKNDAHSRQDLLRLLKSDRTTLKESMKTLQELKAVHVDAFVMGNISKPEAKTAVQSFLTGAGFGTLPMRDAARSLVVEQKTPIEAVVPNPIPHDVNHATVVHYQLGVPSIEERVNLEVLGQMLNRRLFDRLRTEEQLGYIVGARSYIDSSVESLRCVLEGSKKHPDEVAELIETELRSMEEHLRSMPDEEFEHYKESTRAELQKPVQNFSEEFVRSWDQISNHGHCFNKRDLELTYLGTDFTRKQLIRTYTKLLEPSRRLVVKLVANLQPSKEITLIGHESLLSDGSAPLEQKRSKGAAFADYSPKLQYETDCSSAHKRRTGLALQSLDEGPVSKYQEESGFYPEVTVCELAPSMLLKLEEDL